MLAVGAGDGMTLHALDVLGDAVTATREYRPRGLGQWLWVTVVALFVGSTSIGLPSGGGGGTGGTGDVPTTRSGEFGGEFGSGPPPGTMEVIVLIVAVVAVLWLLFVVLGALLEFPFLAWLRDGKVDTSAEVAAHPGQSLGLAAFRIVLTGLGLAVTMGLLVAAVGTNGDPMEFLVAAGNLAIVIGLIGLPIGLVQSFTTAFVVPTMAIEDTGVLGGWRRFWGPLTDAPKQFVVYAVAVAVLSAVGGIIVLLVALLALIPALIVGGIVGVVVAVGTSPFVGVAVAAAFGGVAFAVVALVGFALLKVFLRYYALFVLARVDGDLDYLPERRREVGAGAPAADTADGTDDTPESDRGRDDPQVGPA